MQRIGNDFIDASSSALALKIWAYPGPALAIDS